MRFCPFCSAENADELAVCQACGRRLPPLPPRRTRANAPPTGVTVPTRIPPVPRASSSPPAPAEDLRTTQPYGARRDEPRPSPSDADRNAILNAISPGPAAQRREPPPPEAPDPDHARRANDAPRPKPPTTPPPMPQVRVKPPTLPPSLPPPGPHAPPIAMTPPAATPVVPAYPVIPSTAADDDPVAIAARRLRDGAMEPPPTRIQHLTDDDRPFTPPKVNPVPEIPEPGLVNAARYTIQFWLAKWQRRGAIKTLGAEIKQDTEALDQVLGALGKEARNARVEGRVFSAENAAISEAEARMGALAKEHSDVDARKAEENSKFEDVERERNTKLTEAEKSVDEAQKELASLEAQRRGLRDKRKDLERRQKVYLKNAEDHDRQAGASQFGDARQELRRGAEGYRKEAAALEPERQNIDRQLAGLERPIGEATAKLDAAKAELDAAKRSLHDAREGHHHRLQELDAEQKRKSRDIALAEAEIQRRLVTLGTLVNLNRIEDATFSELYQRIDRIRGAITARTTEIEKLTAEREAVDKATQWRGVATIGGAIVIFIALIAILMAIF
ncbi:MAG TPA: hypothetical protein VFQ53_38200 [Kofleriaceae bacterium]|nr:hypothetical protein [Kofleriaceae bacterium]